MPVHRAFCGYMSWALRNGRYTSSVGYRTTPGSVFNLTFHLVWRPKVHLPVLGGEVAEDLDGLLREKAEGLDVEHLAVRPDHVYLFVKAPPDHSPAKLAREFEGYMSRILRQRRKHSTTRMPTLWSRSYYAGSAGHVSDATISRYIAAQESQSVR